MEVGLLAVDSRWSGKNGIGRYASEILERLSIPWTSLAPAGSPSSATDFLLKDIRIDGRTPDHIYSPGYNGFARRVPQTVTVLDLIHLRSPGSAKYRPYYDLFLKPLIKRNGHVLTISDTSRSDIQDWLADPSVDVINAGIGKSPEFVLEGPRRRSERPYFLYVGNLKPHKNVPTILAAMRGVPEADLLIVTSDPQSAWALAAQHGVSGQVQVMSGISDAQLAELYRGARATLQPSLLEGFGLPALEAALCGSPVIFSYQCESVREICAAGGIAIADALSPEEWASSMTSVDEGDRYPESRLDADRYSWDRVAGTVSSILSHRLGMS